jgi:beta propeller repeat protein
LAFVFGVAALTLGISPAHGDLTVGTTTQISSAPGIQGAPSISGDIIVWGDQNSSAPGIYGYNLQTKQTFAIATGSGKGSPQISGSIVAWCEPTPGYGYGYGAKNLDTGQYYTLESSMGGYMADSYLSIVGHKVYFSVYDSMRDPQGIYCMDLDTGTKTMLLPRRENSYDPDANQKWVVWATTGGTLYLNNLATGVTKTLTNPWGGEMSAPSLAGDCIYYQVMYDNTSSHERIERYDIDTGTFSIVSQGRLRDVNYPSADGSIVVWGDYDAKPSHILNATDVSTGQTVPVVDVQQGFISYSQQGWEYDAGRLVWVWESSDYTQAHVYLTEITPEPATLGLLALGGLALIRRGGIRTRPSRPS